MAFLSVGTFDENLVQPSIQVHRVVVASTGKFPYSRSCIQITKFFSVHGLGMLEFIVCISDLVVEHFCLVYVWSRILVEAIGLEAIC